MKEKTRAMGRMSEFREFAVKGNVVDLAVGVIIGAAFGKIVDSLVNDLIMPVIGKATGGLEFTNYFIPLSPIPPGVPHTLKAMKDAGVPVLASRNFANVVLHFVLLALVVFLMSEESTRLRRREAPFPPAPPEQVVLLRE